MVLRVLRGAWQRARVWAHRRVGTWLPGRPSAPTADELVPDLPKSCLRALRKQDWVTGGRVALHAFMPDDRTAKTRDDGGREVSVNWEDHPTAVLAFTLKDKNAAHGVARLPRAGIERTNSRPGAAPNALWCERKEVPGNPHHGNVLIRVGLEKVMTTMIASALALESTLISARHGRQQP